jgi:quercetin dioxygenase-like cupin family protein
MAEIVKRKEFMTTWHASPNAYLPHWSERKKQNLMGSGTSTRAVPPFRAFDLLATPNQSLVLLSNDDHRIGVASICGAQTDFRRHVDFDTVYLQFAGRTLLETEFGEYEMRPGDLIHIPEGIAHRATGSADSLVWFAHVVDPFVHFMHEDDQVSHTEFEVTRLGGPSWHVAQGHEQPQKSGKMRERMICWADRPNDKTIIERDYDELVGATSTQLREKVSGIRKLRCFDLFKEIAGTSGEPKPVFRSRYLELKTYNIIGEQFAFHRALRSEEVRIQFRGAALDMSELGNAQAEPGRVTVIPRGIAHSVVTDPADDKSFLRLNFYSNLPWSYPSDFTRHFYDSRFEVKTKVLREAAWKQAAE